MKKILGILGGMSWESTALYYRLLNQGVAARLGGLHSADLLLRSVEFASVAALQQAGDWAAAGALLGEAGAGLKAAGAQRLLIATNTMHKVADEVERRSGLPLIHIVDATAAALQAAGVRRAGLLATAYTMEQDFYIGRMRERFAIELLVPDAPARAEVHRVIYEELCRGRILDSSQDFYRRVVQDLADQGAEAIILGCTEISLLLDPADPVCGLSLFDSTALHAAAAVEWMLGARQPPSPATMLD